MTHDQSNLPLGPNGEIPLRRDPETGKIKYLTLQDLWDRQTRYPPDVAVHAIGEFQKAIERLRVAAGRQETPERPEPAPASETDPTADRDPDALLTAKEVGEILGIPTKSVYELGGLERVQVGERRVRWRLSDVREFIERRRKRF